MELTIPLVKGLPVNDVFTVRVRVSVSLKYIKSSFRKVQRKMALKWDGIIVQTVTVSPLLLLLFWLQWPLLPV